MLTEEQIQHYYREGYVLLPGLVSKEATQAVVAAAPDFAATNRWQARIFAHDDPQKDKSIHRLLVEPAVVEAVQDLLSSPPRVWYGMLAVVQPHGGHGLP